MRPTAMDALLSRWITDQQPVGAAVAVVGRRGILWRRGTGSADLDAGRAMDPDATVMNVASVSKTVTAAAILQLVEDGRLSLEDPVEEHLPFLVRHPQHPQPITLRQLLTHTSAIADGPAYRASYVPGDPPDDLGEWLARYLDPAGDLFVAERNWQPWPPGTARAYSNVGFGLLGHVAEIVTGEPFRALTRRAIFGPLGMASSGWFLADIDAGRLATPYLPASPDPASPDALLARPGTATRRWRPAYQYGFPTYPDGLLRTTAADLARFARAMLEDGRGSGLLGPSSLAAAFDPFASGLKPGPDGLGQGLAWRSRPSRSGRDLWVHGGNDPGVSALVVLDRSAGLGVVLLSNSATSWTFDFDDLLDAAAAVAGQTPGP